MKKILPIILCLSAFVNATSDVTAQSSEQIENNIEKIIKKLIQRNRKIRSITDVFEGNRINRNIDITKDLVRVDLSTGKNLTDSSPEFSSIKFRLGLNAGVNTMFSIKAVQGKYKESFYASHDPSIYDVDKTIVEYLGMVVKYKKKKELLIITKEYLETKKRDLREFSVRMKHNDVGKDELSEAVSELSDAENNYNKLVNEVVMYEKFLNLYMPKDEKTEKDQDNSEEFDVLDISEVESFIHASGLLESNGHRKSKLKLQTASAQKLANVAEFTPQVGLNFENHLKAKENMKPNEKDSVSLVFSMNLAPSQFFKAVKACKDYESCVNNNAWESAKQDYELKKFKTDVENEKASCESAKIAMQSKKIILDSILAQHEGGLMDQNSKIRQARSDYQRSIEKYAATYEKYVDAAMEYLKVTGKLRELYFEQHPEFN